MGERGLSRCQWSHHHPCSPGPGARPQSLPRQRGFCRRDYRTINAASGAGLPAPDKFWFRRSSVSTLISSATAEHIHLPAAKPSLFGAVRGELFKISHQWITWIMAVLLGGIITLPYLVMLTVPGAKDALIQGPEHYISVRMQSNLAVFRAFAGIYLLIITVYIIGQEYQLGTIRILLGR